MGGERNMLPGFKFAQRFAENVIVQHRYTDCLIAITNTRILLTFRSESETGIPVKEFKHEKCPPDCSDGHCLLFGLPELTCGHADLFLELPHKMRFIVVAAL